MECKNLYQILPAPNFAILVTKFSPQFFLRNLSACYVFLHDPHGVHYAYQQGPQGAKLGTLGCMASIRLEMKNSWYAMHPILYETGRLCW